MGDIVTPLPIERTRSFRSVFFIPGKFHRALYRMREPLAEIASLLQGAGDVIPAYPLFTLPRKLNRLTV